MPEDGDCREKAVTSFRWSVLPHDADRLCMQKLARSPSGSCQDRGVCRKTYSKTGSSAGRKQPGGFLDRGGGLYSFLTSVHQPHGCTQHVLSFQAGKPCVWPHPDFYSPGNLPQGPTVLTSSLFYFCIVFGTGDGT